MQFVPKKTVLILLLVLIDPVFAQDGDMALEDLMDMSITELLNVSVASTRKENIAQTPAVVSRYEAADMADLGLNTLEEMLSFIPGFVVQRTEIGTAAVMIRGLVESFNQKVLFMLDGVPYWQASHGDNALLGIPFEAIERVEVIRGPGAVMYGTNATGGVINVITRGKSDNQATLAFGSNGYKHGAAYVNGEWGPYGRLSLTVSGKREDGYDGYYSPRGYPPFYPADTPLDGSVKRYVEHDSLLLRFDGNRLDAGLHMFGSDSSGLAAAGAVNNVSELKYRGSLLWANYHVQKKKYDFTLFADYNRFYLSIPTEALFNGRDPGVQGFKGNGNDNFRIRAGARFEYHFNEQLHWLMGFEEEERSIGEYGNTPLVEGYSRVVTMAPQELNETGFYSQIDWSRGKWRALVGGRFVDNERAGSKFMPRGSLIYQLSESRSLKLLYSTGFNSPNFLQQAINIPFVVAGDPNNTAETVRTIDLAYTLTSDKHLFVINAYNLEAKDFLRRVPNPNAPGSLIANSDNFNRSGVELDYQRALPKGRLFANLAWQKEANEVREGDGTALFAPQWKVSLGSYYQIDKSQRIGGSVGFISEREAVSAQTTVNLSYNLKLGDFTLNVDGNNLLGEDLVTPDVANFVPNRLSPGGDSDPNGSLGITWHF